MVSTAILPVIDLSPLQHPSTEAYQALAEQFCAACRSPGFAYLTHHGIPQSQIDEVFAAQRAFFDLPLEVKQKAKRPEHPQHHRGYLGPRSEQIRDTTQSSFNKEDLARLGPMGSEAREAFLAGAEKDCPFPNVWIPEEDLPGFRATLERFLDTAHQLELDLLALVGSGLPGSSVQELQDGHGDLNNALRLMHYLSSPYSQFESGQDAWAAPHADYGTFTFLFQQDVAGLEVLDPDNLGTFIPVPPKPGAIVFNVGNALEWMTNGEFKSALHRVTPPRPQSGSDSGDRHSFGYFSQPNRDFIMKPIPGTGHKSGLATNANLAYGDYIQQVLSGTMRKSA